MRRRSSQIGRSQGARLLDFLSPFRARNGHLCLFRNCNLLYGWSECTSFLIIPAIAIVQGPTYSYHLLMLFQIRRYQMQVHFFPKLFNRLLRHLLDQKCVQAEYHFVYLRKKNNFRKKFLLSLPNFGRLPDLRCGDFLTTVNSSLPLRCASSPFSRKSTLKYSRRWSRFFF